MDTEKKFFGKWWLWIFLLITIAIIILGTLNYIGLVGKTFIERKVFEQSYQKQEADKTAITTYRAQLAILRARLNNITLDENAKAEIRAQIDALTILKSTKED